MSDPDFAEFLDDDMEGLTPEFAQKVFPIAPSLRRRYARMFDEYIDEIGVKDDDLFYNAVAEALRDPGWVANIEAAFIKNGPKDKGRSFIQRAMRWLNQNTDLNVEDSSFALTPVDQFKPGSPERALYALVKRFFEKPSDGLRGDDPWDGEATLSEEQAPALPWSVALRRLVEMLSMTGARDRAWLAELRGAFDDFETKCERALDEEEAADGIAVRRLLFERRLNAVLEEAEDKLRMRLEPVRQRLPQADAEMLTRMDSALSAVVAAADAAAIGKTFAEEARNAYQAVIERAVIDPRALGEAGPHAERLLAAQAGEATAAAALAAALAELCPGDGAAGDEQAEGWDVPSEEVVSAETDEAEDAPDRPQAMPAERLDGEELAKSAVHGSVEEGTDARGLEEATRTEVHARPVGDRTDPAAETPTALPEPQPRPGGAPVAQEVTRAKIETEPEHLEAEGFAADAEGVPAVWGGPLPLDRLVADYLATGEICFAWRLANLAHERGFVPGIPPSVLKATVASGSVSGPYEASAQRVSELLSEAAAALEQTELVEEAGPEAAVIAENARSMFFAALLRPAVLAPDSNARLYLSGLSMRGPLAPYQALQKALSELGFDLRPTMDELAEAAGRARNQRLPSARQELREWLESARQARSVHVPTHVILHDILSARGEIGQVIEAALDDRPQAESTVEDFLERFLGSREASEEMIQRAEQRTGRPRRDRIRDQALDWACRKIDEGCHLLDAWLKALRGDRSGFDDRMRAALVRHIGTLRKAVESCRATAATTPAEAGGEGVAPSLAASVAEVVARSVDDFDRLLSGEVGPPVRLWEAFNAPLLRLPAGCQPAGSIRPGLRRTEETDRWRQEHRSHQFAALMNPGTIAADEAQALPLRRQEAGIRPALRLLERLSAAGALTPERLGEERQAIEEQSHASARRVRERVEALRLDLAALDSLDHGAGTEVVDWLDRLRDLAETLSAPHLSLMIGGDDASARTEDFPEIEFLLGKAQAFRSRIDRHIIADQRRRLEILATENPDLARDVARLVASLEARDRVTVEDQIAQLRDGQPMLEEELPDDDWEDAFEAFYPGFVQRLPEARDLPLGTIMQELARGGIAGPMDFKRLDPDQRVDARLLVETWRGLDNAMRTPGDAMRDSLRKLMEALGFSSVGVEGENQLIPGRLLRCQVSTDVPTAGRWFLPPAFGSMADGMYPVFLARSDVPDDQLGAKLADARRSAPCILIVFGRLNRQRRESFARLMRRDKQTVMLIDETQILFLAANASDRMERLVACTTPFGYLQPYTTDAGSIPTEMFFGRVAEIEKIESRSTAGCLVFGGRQLGKSALLNHVRKRMHAPLAGVVAIYRDIEMVGRSDTPADRVWGVIGDSLAPFDITTDGQAEKAAVLEAIRGWLAARADRRVLMLLDETDNFLASENQRGYPNLRPLKDLMEATDRRFKVVFAGLHNVCRTTRVPNSPLVHLGDPICVGPLNTSAENSTEARRMVTAPMQAAGYDYESPVLAWDILARVNHYPSLVQVFLKTLLEGLASHPARAGQGPRWRLAGAQIFESGSAQEINRLIRERFQWTLDLDPRYELIAKVLAMLRLQAKEGGSVDAAGLLPEEIAAEVAPWWPDTIRRLSAEDFHAFLDEMVGLGVLARFGARQDRYGLRSALVAQMLGARSDLEEQILRIATKEPRATYDSAEFHRRVDIAAPNPRAPLSDRALGDLFDPEQPGVRILVAAPSVWGDGLADMLARLGADWTSVKGRLASTVAKKGDTAVFRQEARGKAPRRIVIVGHGDWDETMVKALSQLGTVKRGEVLPVLVAEPEAMAARLLKAGEADLPARLFFAQPWSETMIRSWLEEVSLEPLDSAPLRKLLISGTGGAPARLASAHQRLVQLAVSSRSRLEAALGDWRAEQGMAPEDVGLPQVLIPLLGDLVTIIDEGRFESLDTIASVVALPPDVSLRRAFKVLAVLGLIVPVDVETAGVSPTALARLIIDSEAGRASATVE